MSVPIGHANTVVVGVDGSESAREAVRWAAAEAGRRDAVLRIVHAELPLPADALDMTGMARQALHDEAMSWVRTAIRTAGEIAPGVETQARVEVGLAALLLEEESAASALVVVGINGAPENWYVLDRAFAEAEARGAGLVAVHVWQPPLGSAKMAESVGIVWSELDAVREAMVTQRLEACADRHPGVRVTTRVVHGSAAHRLVEAAEGACLLVVGSRGTGGLTGMVLGSTSQAVVRHAPCPVLLVRPVLAEQIRLAQQAD